MNTSEHSDGATPAVRLRPEIVAAIAYRQGKPAPADAFKLSSNENPFPPHPAVIQAIAASVANRYPDAAAAELRARLAERFGVTDSHVHIGSGSVAIIYQLVQAAATVGDEIIYPWRSFEAYPGIVTVAGATSVAVPTLPDYRHDLEGMLAAITDRTRVIVLCTPNNPSGTVLTKREVTDFLAKVPPSILVILDEAYGEFCTDPDAVNGAELLADHPNLVLLRTFSKAYGLAGLRVGYAIGEPAVLNAARITAIPFSVTEAAQRAAIAALDHEEELFERVAALIELRERMWTALREQGWDVPHSEGNFLWLPTGELTDQAEDILLQHGIVARALGEGVRVTVGETESVEKLLEATAEIVEKLPIRA